MSDLASPHAGVDAAAQAPIDCQIVIPHLISQLRLRLDSWLTAHERELHRCLSGNLVCEAPSQLSAAWDCSPRGIDFESSLRNGAGEMSFASGRHEDVRLDDEDCPMLGVVPPAQQSSASAQAKIVPPGAVDDMPNRGESKQSASGISEAGHNWVVTPCKTSARVKSSAACFGEEVRSEGWVRSLVAIDRRISSVGGSGTLLKGATSVVNSSKIANLMIPDVTIPKSMKNRMNSASKRSSEFQRTLKSFMHSKRYEVPRVLLTLLDACFIVFYIEYGFKLIDEQADIRDQWSFVVISAASCLAFTIDVTLRITADNFDLSWDSGAGWRWFNILTVSTHLLHTLAHVFPKDQFVSLHIFAEYFVCLRIVRVMSLVQVTSVIRNHEGCRELRIMVHSLTGALMSLLWCSCLIFIILVFFGVFFAGGVLAKCRRTEFDNHNGLEELMDLRHHFGSVGSSAMSLYKAMSGGVDWGDTLYVVAPLGWEFSTVFVVFITFAFIALLNVATAVFVEATMRRSNTDRDMMVQNELNDTREFLDSMTSMFEELDYDNTQGISFEELATHLRDPRIGAYFSRLGVDVENAHKLFKLLDMDQDGSINASELSYGCLRLRGDAKNLDIEDVRRILKTMYVSLENQISCLGDVMLDRVEKSCSKQIEAATESARQAMSLSDLNASQSSSLRNALKAHQEKIESAVAPLAGEIGRVSRTLSDASARRARRDDRIPRDKAHNIPTSSSTIQESTADVSSTPAPCSPTAGVPQKLLD
jgi:Ca2+-binding EF-hand superfamily protein